MSGENKCHICGAKLEHGLCPNSNLSWHRKAELAEIQAQA